MVRSSVSLALVLGMTWVAPGLLSVDAISFIADHIADVHVVRLRSRFNAAFTDGGHVLNGSRGEGEAARGYTSSRQSDFGGGLVNTRSRSRPNQAEPDGTPVTARKWHELRRRWSEGFACLP